MELQQALEAYLVETGQIHALAARQARMLSRSVADASRQKEAQILLLLAIAALNRGAPRAPETFLLKPLEQEAVHRHVEACKTERPGFSPGWEPIVTGPGAFAEAKKILGESLQSRERLAPLTGKPPEKDGRYPLLVIEGSGRNTCIGFSRYWKAAVALEGKIRERLRRPVFNVPGKDAAAALAEVFVADSGGAGYHYRQAAAAALALRTPFFVVSGGPGTGKTWVALQILRTLLRVFKEIAPDRIALCAPTGRAKSRLGESIDNGLEALRKTGARAADPLFTKSMECKTLHGLMGMRPDGSMKYSTRNPLPHQVIVVDEASMVDLHLFAALLDAASADCRILLIGDMHQLPSVGAGAVLGDLTGRFIGPDYPTLTKETGGWLQSAMKGMGSSDDRDFSSLVLPAAASETAGPLADHAVILTNSFRSAKEILAVSTYVNNGETEKALDVFAGNSDSPERAVELDSRAGQGPIVEWIVARFTKEIIDRAAALRDADLEAMDDFLPEDTRGPRPGLKAVLDAFDASRILTFTNAGPRGRIAVNLLAEKLLRPRLAAGSVGRFFHGQQVMISRNLHDLDLFNGDTGMVVQTKNSGLKVVFRRGAGGKKYAVHPLERLIGIEAAFAMTVHKSQGSEFGEVMLVLPEKEGPLLTRQVLYTGITRAKNRIVVLGSGDMFKTAIDTREERPGGIVLD